MFHSVLFIHQRNDLYRLQIVRLNSYFSKFLTELEYMRVNHFILILILNVNLII